MGAWRGPGQDAGSPRGHVAGKGRGRAAGGEGVAAPASSSHRMDAIAPDSPCRPHPEIAAASAGEGAAAPPDRAARELVLRTIAAHAPSLLGTARRYSLCTDDAQDAYQRALEIFLRRAEAVNPDHAVGWLRTVVKHEALAVRAGRLRLVGAAEVDLDREEAGHPGGAEARAALADGEASAEDLAGIRPHLRACAGCRAALRGFRAAPGAVAALAPAALATPGDDASSALVRAWDVVTSGLHERAAGAAHALH